MITEDEMKVIKELQNKAGKMITKIKAGLNSCNLSNIDYARCEYWNGKVIAIEEVLGILKGR